MVTKFEVPFGYWFLLSEQSDALVQSLVWSLLKSCSAIKISSRSNSKWKTIKCAFSHAVNKRKYVAYSYLFIYLFIYFRRYFFLSEHNLECVIIPGEALVPVKNRILNERIFLSCSFIRYIIHIDWGMLNCVDLNCWNMSIGLLRARVHHQPLVFCRQCYSIALWIVEACRLASTFTSNDRQKLIQNATRSYS